MLICGYCSRVLLSAASLRRSALRSLHEAKRGHTDPTVRHTGRHALHSIQNRIGKHFEANGAVAEKTKLALKAVEDFFEKRALQVPISIRSFAINSVISWIDGANNYTRWQSLGVVLLP